jgi:hypothetical protein
MKTIVDNFKSAGIVKGEIEACDATFIEAYNKKGGAPSQLAGCVYLRFLSA